MSDNDVSARPFPAFLDLTGKLCVVVGGRAAAERRVRSLVAAGADVVVIAAEITPRLADLARDDHIGHEEREYVRGDLAGARLVVCASGSVETDRAAAEEARAERALVHAPSVPELSDVSLPSIVRRGPLQIAISTSGAAPELAKRIRRELAEQFDEDWERYLALLAELRRVTIERVPSEEKRAAMFRAMAESNLLERIKADDRLRVDLLYLEFFQAAQEDV